MLRDRKLALLAVASIFVRGAFLFAHRIDSDEPQHLHVAWAWSRGLVQYRDVFDNHFPLLHLLFAPLMRFVPESSTVFLIARLAIAPIAIACAYLLYRVAEPLIGERRAAVAAIVFGVMPPWLPKSVEFRNDTLWIFFWLAMLALIARKNYIWAGVAAGLCVLASVKALPLFLAHALAMTSGAAPALGAGLSPFGGRSGRRSTVLRVAVGAAIPLVAAALFFAAYGALDDMLYATLFFNASLPVHAARRIGGALAFAAVAPLAFRRANVAVWYCVVMLCFWPSISPRDFLPLVPLAAIALATTRIPAIVLFITMTLASVWYARLWQPADESRQEFVDAAVRLTTPDEYVFDLKGNAVFRRRPVHAIYDIVGRALYTNDGASEEIVARRCCVAIDDMSHIPARTRAFLNRNFVDIGPLRVCGSVARDGAFTIAVPQTYAVLARNPARVTIDGAPYRGPRFLAAGRHTLVAAEPESAERVTVIWWRAAWGGKR